MFSYRPLIDPGAHESRALSLCSNRFVAGENKPGKPDKPGNGSLGKGAEQFGSASSVSESQSLPIPSAQVTSNPGSPGSAQGAVKDAQRTKTDAETRRTLTIVWGTNKLPGRTARTVSWYRELLERLGAVTETLSAVCSENPGSTS